MSVRVSSRARFTHRGGSVRSVGTIGAMYLASS